MKRAPSSQKNIKEEIKPPVEVKKKSTKVKNLLFRKRLSHPPSTKLILEIKKIIIKVMRKFRMQSTRSIIILRRICPNEILFKTYLNP